MLLCERHLTIDTQSVENASKQLSENFGSSKPWLVSFGCGRLRNPAESKKRQPGDFQKMGLKHTRPRKKRRYRRSAE